MTHKLSFTVVTPEKIIYEAEIDSATIPTKEGEITVLANHTPLVSLLSSGEMIIKKNKDEKFHFGV